MQKMERSNREVWVKALIYGASGMGKTTFGVTAPKPLVLLSERQGYEHIEAAVARTGVPDPQVLFMESVEDYQHVVRSLRAATTNPAMKKGPFVVKDASGAVMYENATWPDTIVVDSITDVCRMIEDDIIRVSPPKIGKDGLPTFAMNHWGVLGDRCGKFFRLFRDLDFHVIHLAVEDDRMVGEGDQAERKVEPALPMRKLSSVLAQTVNVVGIMARSIVPKMLPDGTRDESQIRYAVRTVGPSYYLLKPYRPLKDMEVADFSAWVKAISEARRGRLNSEAAALAEGKPLE